MDAASVSAVRIWLDWKLERVTATALSDPEDRVPLGTDPLSDSVVRNEVRSEGAEASGRAEAPNQDRIERASKGETHRWTL